MADETRDPRAEETVDRMYADLPGDIADDTEEPTYVDELEGDARERAETALAELREKRRGLKTG